MASPRNTGHGGARSSPSAAATITCALHWRQPSPALTLLCHLHVCVLCTCESCACREELAPIIMDRALTLHHSTVRRVMFRHAGYEAVNEGGRRPRRGDAGCFAALPAAPDALA